jgi:DNA polymerase I-like protein with 3'-5' exonuclease and polymerase domains
MIITFDVETSTLNKGNPFSRDGKLLSYAIKEDDEETSFSYYTEIDFLSNLKSKVPQAKLLVGFNIKFDLHWARRYGVEWSDSVRVWDCQIAEFIIRGQSGSYPSLNESLERFGPAKKDDKIAEYWELGVDTADIPVEELKQYNLLDVDLTYNLYLKQLDLMTDKQKRLCYLMGLDLLVLQEMEWNGILFDVEECKKRAKETEDELKRITDELLTHAPTPNINFDSGHQLSCFLFGGGFELTLLDHVSQSTYKSGDKAGQPRIINRWRKEVHYCKQLFTPIKGSQTKLTSKVDDKTFPIYSTNEDCIRQLKAPTKAHKRIVELLLARAKQAKLLDTYYKALPALMDTMQWGDILHGQYNQVVARTGRLSSSSPNQQNFSGDVDQLLISRFNQ